MSGPSVADPEEERPPARAPGHVPGPAHAGPQRRRSGTAVAVLVPCAVTLVLGLWGLDRSTLWRDEAVTAQVAGRTLPQLWDLLGTSDAVHGLYYALMHGYGALVHGLFGLPLRDGPVLRLPSVLGAAAAAGLVALLGSRLAAPRVGLWAGLLLAALPSVSHYAQEGRSYALVAAGAALATLLLTTAVRSGRARDWAGYAAVTATTAVLHEFAALILAAHAVTLLISRVPRAVWWRWAAACCAVAAALSPVVLVSRSQRAQIDWLAAPGARAAGHALSALAGPSPVLITVLLALTALAAVRPLPRRGGPLGAAAVAVPWAVVPPLLLFAAAQQLPVLTHRYLFFAVPGLALAAAAGAESLVDRVTVRRGRRFPPRWVAAAGAACVAAAFLGQLPAQQRERRPESRADNLAAVAALVRREARPGDGVFFLPRYERSVLFAHPESFRGLTDLTLRAGPDRSGTLYGRNAPLREIRARLLRADRVWLVVADGVDRTRWFRHSAWLRANWRLLHEVCVQRAWLDGDSGNVALFVRRR
ncbi:glycosyltransferase family 39 protein [Streptomyces niger]|uniref:glycosyltransferase family 39 protein n=1 Tax=Streptomyces niger TaxID=66373 RepID=UPI00069C52FD|nr:glycosyltransferase family 39 protein [Streptomyces niger]